MAAKAAVADSYGLEEGRKLEALVLEHGLDIAGVASKNNQRVAEDMVEGNDPGKTQTELSVQQGGQPLMAEGDIVKPGSESEEDIRDKLVDGGNVTADIRNRVVDVYEDIKKLGIKTGIASANRQAHILAELTADADGHSVEDAAAVEAATDRLIGEQLVQAYGSGQLTNEGYRNVYELRKNSGDFNKDIASAVNGRPVSLGTARRIGRRIRQSGEFKNVA